MVDEMVRLRAHPRTILGKEVKRIRRQSLTPVHLYGPGLPSLALQVDSVKLRDALTIAGRSRPVSVEVEGSETPFITFVRDIQFHPLDSSVLHVDFLGVDVSGTIEVDVPIVMEGEAPAARMLGGSLIQMLNNVRVQASPLEIPAGVAVDVSYLDDFSKSIRVADLEVAVGATIISDPDLLVARVTPPVSSEVAEGVDSADLQASSEEPEVVTGVAEGRDESPA